MGENRRLATIEPILNLEPIDGADRIEKATVRGWSVVVKKGEFEVGDLCVFFEIDSFIPATDDNRPTFGFLDGPDGKDSTRVNDEGQRGWVLKTRKMKGCYSQGLALPINSVLDEKEQEWMNEDPKWVDHLTDYLGIKVFERPMNAQLRGLARGTRPHFVPKTDEPRIQNMQWALDKWADLNWVATQKLDGSSMSVYINFDGIDFRTGVCSRNMDLKNVPESTFWKVAKNDGLIELMDKLLVDYSFTRIMTTYSPKTIVLQGELFGGNIQGNPLNSGNPKFRAFNLVVDGVVIPRAEWPQEILDISVPTFDLPFPKTLEEALEQADQVTTQIGNGPVEGIVYRCRDKSFDQDGHRLSVKAISNKYLAKHDR